MAAETGWTDTSSWSRGEDRSVPKEWTYCNKDLRVILHHHMFYPPEMWLVSCHALNVDRMELDCPDVEGAKVEALGLVRVRALNYAQWAEEGMRGQTPNGVA